MSDIQQFWCAAYVAAMGRGMQGSQARSAADSAVAAYLLSNPPPATPPTPAPTPPKIVALYRLRKGGDHFYTISAAERDSAISDYGYTSEGTACYVYDGPVS